MFWFLDNEHLKNKLSKFDTGKKTSNTTQAFNVAKLAAAKLLGSTQSVIPSKTKTMKTLQRRDLIKFIANPKMSNNLISSLTTHINYAT